MSKSGTNRIRHARTIVRCVLFAAAIVLLLGPWPLARLAVPATSPFTGIASSLATRILGVGALVFLPVLFLALIWRRWFCRWGCPVGLMTECVGRISPVSPTRCKRVPRLGLWLVCLSVSAGAVGYPVLLWLDPLAIFSGALGLAVDFSTVAAQAAGAGLAIILVLSLVLPGAWCLKVCPLGATQELLAAPRIWLSRRDLADTTAADDDELIAESISRRALLTTTIGAGCVLAGVPLGLMARSRLEDGEAAVLRPPGAAPEWQFGQLCLRCGNCVRSCPSKIVTTRWHSQTWSNWLAPEITFDADYCREDCFACMQVCPSGALAMPTAEAGTKPSIGLAHVLMDRCLLALGQECRTMCLDACPYEAITLHEWTFEDDRRYPIVTTENCPGCGACQVACTPMDAIVVQVPESDILAVT